MRQPSGLRATALVALCAVELVSLATIIVAAATAPLVPDTAEPEPLAGPDRELPNTELEVAALERRNGRRCFRRVADVEIPQILS